MKELEAVGCYIFQGGFTVGVAKRFNVLAHLEDGDFGVPTFKLNFPDVPVHTSVPDWPLADLAGQEVALLYGNPPCAPFSPVGSTLSPKYKALGGWRADPRLGCWKNLVNAATVIRPKVFVGESVPRFYTAGWELSSSFARTFLEMGYSVTFVLHDIKFMGAAQQRRRVFLVAHKVKLDWPAPNLRATLRQALEGLDDPGPYREVYDEVAEMIHVLKPGSNLRRTFRAYYGEEAFLKGGVAHRPRFTIGRPAWDSPTGTVFGNTMVHPDEPRFFGVHELMRLMGYPDGYQWAHWDAAKIINEMVKAVTPFAATYVANVVADGLVRNERLRKPKVTEVRRWAKSPKIKDFDLITAEVDITDKVMEGAP